MASAREERMQQRLRGSQRRQVKDVDFGLTFPVLAAPAQESVPSQLTPGPVLAPALSTRQTPASQGRGHQHAAIVSLNKSTATRGSTNDANTSAKRRKLNSDQPPSSSTRSTRSSQAVSRPDTYLLPDESGREPSLLRTINDSIEQEAGPDELDVTLNVPRPRVEQTPSLPISITEEVTESPRDAPGSGHRVRLSANESILRSSQVLDELMGASPTDFEHIDSSPALGKSRRTEATPRQPLPFPRRSPSSQTSQADNDEFDELSPDQPRGRDRKPKQLAERPPDVDLEEEEEVTQDLIEEAVEIDDNEAAAILKKNQGERVASGSPDLDEPRTSPVVARKKRGNKHKVSSPAQQRQPKNIPQARQDPAPKATKKVAKSNKVRIGSPIPITVHRFTKRPVYEDDSDTDILNSDIPYINRGGVNAIDVLSQVCHEIINSGLGTLKEGGRNCNDPALRREYRTKWSALEVFGRELQARLLEHTINLDNSFSLRKRAREEHKKRLALREDILRIRAEREQVALRMDEIRIKHESETMDAQERDSLNNTIHDIELAIDRGKEQDPLDSANGAVEMAGVELLVKRVAGEVSNKSDSGGILKQIQEFNSFLERAALVLETRSG